MSEEKRNKKPERKDNPLPNFRHVYDMTGTLFRTWSLDAGEHLDFMNVLGNLKDRCKESFVSHGSKPLSKSS